jgi:hypothetical protein
MKSKRSNYKIFIKICGYLFFYSLFVLMGFITGMVYQQLLFTREISQVMSYTDISVSFNSTKFSEDLAEKFIPAWKAAFNETLHNQLNLTSKQER